MKSINNFVLSWIIIALSFTSCCIASQTTQSVDTAKTIELELFKKIPIIGDANISPSGLSYYCGSLFYVSDRHDKIYTWPIDMSADTIKPIEFLDLKSNKVSGYHDETRSQLEGIVVKNHKNIYLTFDIKKFPAILLKKEKGTYKVENFYKDSSDMKNKVDSAIWPRDNNGYFEGIAYELNNSNKDIIYLAKERQNRAIWIVSEQKVSTYNITMTPKTKLKNKTKNASDDISALHISNGQLYGIFRAKRAIVPLNKNKNTYNISEYWSYAKKINYNSLNAGPEGLTMNDRYIYLVDDNYASRSEKNTAEGKNYTYSKKPHLYIFKKPK